MSGFAFNPPSSIITNYNPAYFENTQLNSYITYNDANLLFLPKTGGTINYLNVSNNLNIISGNLQLNSVNVNLNGITGVTPGTASANHALITNASNNISSINNLSLVGLNLNSNINISNLLYTDYANSRISVGMSTPYSTLDILTSGSNTLRLSYTPNIVYTDLYCTSVGILGTLSTLFPNRLCLGTSTVNSYLSITSNGSYPDSSYEKMAVFSGSNALPVQLLLECHNAANTTNTNAVFIGSLSNNDLRLGVNNSTKLTISAGASTAGFVGIGTSLPDIPFSVQLNKSYNVDQASAGWSKVSFGSASISTGIGPTSQNISGLFSSGVLCSSLWVQSDLRLKTNFKKLDYSIADKMLTIRPYLYQYKDNRTNGKFEVGYIAQDLLKAGISECVDVIKCHDLAVVDAYWDIKDFSYTIDYPRMVCLLHETVLRLYDRIKQLEFEHRNLSLSVDSKFNKMK